MAGYTVGAGVNYRLGPHTMLGAMYLFTNLGKHTASSSFSDSGTLGNRPNDNPNAPDNQFTSDVTGSATSTVNAIFHSFRISLSHLF